MPRRQASRDGEWSSVYTPSPMAHQYIFTMKDLRKVHPPNREVLKGIWLSFLPGAKIGVLGLNGAGKSTLLRIMAGVEEPSSGEARPAKGIRVGFLPQEPVLDPSKDVLGNIEEGVADTRALLQRFNELNLKLGESLSESEMERVLDEHGRVMAEIETKNAWELDRTVEIAMDALRVPPGDTKVETLSGGERRRVALCRLLLKHPDLLLLDEPTNHLDAESVAWLERFLKEYPGTVVAVTHDRYFLDNVAGWILELDRGAGIPWEGNYSSWLEQKQERLSLEEKTESARQRTLKRELEWIRMSPRARQAKSKARDAQRGEKTVWEEISDEQDEIALGSRAIPSRSYVAMFNFKGQDQQKLVKNLSGGERNRVHLAKLLRSGGNLLLLDEPTNDLDVDTLRGLEEALTNFGGCAVVISHDRWFLDRIATHILAFEGDSKVVWCEGNYQVYESQRKERLGIDADQPHRIRYKALTR